MKAGPKPANPCSPRKRFTSEQAAKAAGIRIATYKKVYRLPHPCSKCNGWHLSQELSTK